MIELELLGASGDAQSLVLTDDSGERYSVLIDDRMRALVRRDRPQAEVSVEDDAEPLRPRQIQELLRAGYTPEEIAAEHNEDVERVRRFEAPVAAEKALAVQQAQAARVGGEPDSPQMGDLVLDRLAARGVDASSLQWDARREAGGQWEVSLTFVQGATEMAAHWLLSQSRTSIEAVDEEARWLTETMVTEPAAAFFTPLTKKPPMPAADVDTELREREELLERLDAERGTPQIIDIDLDDEEDIQLNAEAADLPADAAGADDVDGDATAEKGGARRHSPAFGPFLRRVRGVSAEEDDEEKAGPSDGASDADSDESRQGTDEGAVAGRDGKHDDSPADSDEPAAEAGEADDEAAGGETSGTDATDDAVTDADSGTDSGADSDASDDASEEDEQPTLDGLEAPAAKPDKKGGRKSVPSWDEILFGQKP